MVRQDVDLATLPFGDGEGVDQVVVFVVAVDMVHLFQVVMVRDECLGYQSMNLAAVRFVVHPKHYSMVSVVLLGMRHDAPNRTVVPFH
jgi:hypothetical protein